MSRQALHRPALCMLLSLVLAGCMPLAATTPTPLPRQEETVPQSNPAATAPAQQAVADLAERLSIDEAAVTVVRVEEVDWPDGSLGCPQPDMMYKQMLVNGSFIELEVDGQRYRYHSGGTQAPFLCTSKDEVLPEDLPGGGSGGNMGI